MPMIEYNENGSVLHRIVKEMDRIETTRIGWIKKVDEPTDIIWVDYENNPSQVPIPAKLANRWITFDDLLDAIDRKAMAQIDFENGNPLKPVIREIFYSVSSTRELKHKSTENKVIHIEAEEIILSASKRVVIQSGKAKTTYLSEGGELVTEADQIDSSANKNQRIKGGRILLN